MNERQRQPDWDRREQIGTSLWIPPRITSRNKNPITSSATKQVSTLYVLGLRSP
jgi:hypothetical protein